MSLIRYPLAEWYEVGEASILVLSCEYATRSNSAAINVTTGLHPRVSPKVRNMTFVGR